ncbi:carboxylesterase family protein [Breoghania sp.]|uniref:carboxylesterase family protein n=1 Tax=Breoghania sp. TaxID=2065378 RepID=UPI0026146FE4|nr:carboxylesterase family protein [Breoghania sp.]MDJ0929828.1 carboxylesterase family protein [Breoghania sp.]
MSKPVVTTSAGSLAGIKTGEVESFRGIPYAAPSVGELRWKAPQSPKIWSGVRDASTFGAACIQKEARKNPEKSLKSYPQSEDRLTLNVWRSASTSNAAPPLPVMIWIHGGSFRFGAVNLDLYSGADLARYGAIVVTINYRLGVFGIFSHPALHSASDETDSNYGLLDQIAALRWMKDKIAAFGGYPDNVTVFGESAGGVSVSYLLASPIAKGLFDKAIMESGGLAVPVHSRKGADEIGETVASELGLGAVATARWYLAPQQTKSPKAMLRTFPCSSAGTTRK